MSDSIVSVYSDARTEYTKQLCMFLVPSYFQVFLGLLDKAREAAKPEPKKLLWHFQMLLNDIPEWNMEKVSHEIALLQKACGCDYLEDLLTAVFIAHTKVLTAIRVSSKQKKIQITVPKVEHFLFKVLCETSKLLWGSTYLFREDVSSIEKQQNYRSVESLLQDGVIQAVRSLVPVKTILRDFVSSDNHEEDEEEADVEEAKDAEEAKEAEEVEGAKDAKDAKETEEAEPKEKVDKPEDESSPASIEETVKKIENEMVNPSEQPVIHIDDKPEVSFANFDSVFDSDHPENSDMVYDERPSGTLEKLDGENLPLADDFDIEDLDAGSTDVAPNSDDYEVLV